MSEFKDKDVRFQIKSIPQKFEDWEDQFAFHGTFEFFDGYTDKVGYGREVDLSGLVGFAHRELKNYGGWDRPEYVTYVWFREYPDSQFYFSEDYDDYPESAKGTFRPWQETLF